MNTFLSRDSSEQLDISTADPPYRMRGSNTVHLLAGTREPVIGKLSAPGLLHRFLELIPEINTEISEPFLCPETDIPVILVEALSARLTGIELIKSLLLCLVHCETRENPDEFSLRAPVALQRSLVLFLPDQSAHNLTA